ncbi:PIN domain-containing protein [cf. Phormidesmis sp. LEGE 11477]|uniref:PIN domain-containing protein n=1 Tax=cf. Phormidesmis sp. LEGE 11477 TaxID=1828680 RepID=UPI001882CDD5|nr:PIN domain-containing protein [cf. Phormidesmis sp. LEGE 11477]MBE9063029.1 hypothetical protein [cf. Phormidesmis sp. LEGE 11477]
MTTSQLSLLQKYFQKGILVDTNILLLLFVGELGRERISNFGRTDQFTPRDYDLLIELLKRFKVIATTPNVLTEVNSLLNKLREPARKVFSKGLARLEEIYIPSREVASSNWPFLKYGLTDCGIADIAQSKYLVLTDDLRLASYLHQKGIDTINFNNLRTF